MKKKNIWIHVGIIAAMLVVSLIYFSPVMSGKIVLQGDIVKYEAMVKETKDFHEQTGEYAHWNSAMFSGMPVYQVGGNEPMKSVYVPLRSTVNLDFLDLGRSVGVLFLYLLGFYLAMLVMGCNPWVSLVGALAFGLGSYNIIIVEAGHISKAWAMAMMAPILAGMILCLRKPKEGKNKWKDWMWGGILFTLALGLQLNFNHIQITYYTVIGAVILGLTYAIVAIKQKYVKEFLIALGLLIGASALAFACNARALVVSMEYAKETMRGGNELTVTPENLYGQKTGTKSENTNSGLDIEYAMNGWSYDIGETYTLLVPGAWGGATYETINPEESELVKAFYENGIQNPYEESLGDKLPLYRGDMRYTSGPVYFGAIVIMLFLLGMIAVKGTDRWWILGASIVSIFLAWGYHFLGLNEWLFNNLPFYNKFRTPSMALVLANVCMVIMATLTLKHIFNPLKTEEDQKRILKGLYISAGSTILFILVVLIGTTDFSSPVEEHWPDNLASALRKDRESLFTSDSWRSIIFILLAAATIWLYLKHKIKKAGVALAFLGVLIVIDLWGVDRRYLNNKNFVEKDDSRVTLSDATDIDREIDRQAAENHDIDYRVLNIASGDPFNDSHPSAYHHQLGGYSAVKMSRYQNLIEFYISRHTGMILNIDQYFDSVFKTERLSQEQQIQILESNILHETQRAYVVNMLNAKYLVDRFGLVIRNPYALGNCWLVDNIKAVDNVNDEILSLHDFNPATTAVVNIKEFPDMAKFTSSATQGDTIWMEHQTPYNPDYLKYHSRTSSPRLAVFSEIYYAPDWRVYIDGKPVDYIRVNYMLRGLVIPEGEHTIEFKNEAPLFHKMDTVTLIASIILVLIIGGALYLYYRSSRSQKDSPKEIPPTKKKK